MVPRFSDEQSRLDTLVHRPNRRLYRLDTESDMAIWFHTEISNVVLAVWNHCPPALQTSEAKARTQQPDPETVDVTYSLAIRGGNKPPLVIGEFKRNLIDGAKWREGRPHASLSQELRGYAAKYECPQIFCFDGETLLLLQFRADTAQDMRAEKCKVDCWVIPRLNSDGGCTLREGLHRLLVQGFRRCQALSAVPGLSVHNVSPQYREFFSGRPVFADTSNNNNSGRLTYDHPRNDGVHHNFYREVDERDGSVYWCYNGSACQDEGGNWVYDSGALWGST
ncbi:hypothetical protein RB598_000199 [Gaeumannomyces tritici]